MFFYIINSTVHISASRQVVTLRGMRNFKSAKEYLKYCESTDTKFTILVSKEAL